MQHRKLNDQQQQMIVAWMPFAWATLGKFCRKNSIRKASMIYDDLVSHLHLIVVRAALNFNADVASSFGTYLGTSLRNELPKIVKRKKQKTVSFDDTGNVFAASSESRWDEVERVIAEECSPLANEVAEQVGFAKDTDTVRSMSRQIGVREVNWQAALSEVCHPNVIRKIEAVLS